MRKPGNIFLLAVVLGALSAALVYRHVRQLAHQLEVARGAADRPTADVVVASEALPIGTRLDEHNLRVVQWPIDLPPEGAVRAPDKVYGNILRVSIEKNQPVLQSQVIGQGTGLLPLIISEGMRGMSVKVDDVTGVSGFITPNSRVDVIISGTPDGAPQMKSKVVLQNVRVLATGKLVEQRDEKPVEVPTVTLLVSPDEAEKLTLATRFEPVRLALRNFRDEEIVHTSGIATKALFDSDGRPTTSPVKGTAPAGYSVEILLGETLTRQELF